MKRSWGVAAGARRVRRCSGGLVLVLVLAACGGPDVAASPTWRVAVQSPSAALLSVHGTSADDVWMVGADDGGGALVLHWDGRSWRREAAPDVAADLWWVQALASGAVFMGGSAGTVLERRAGALTRLSTPGGVDDTVFGVWAASETDVYAVGSVDGRSGFIWHFDGQAWLSLALPGGLPLDGDGATPGLFKVWGRSPEDVWVVGDRGVVLRGDASSGFRQIVSGVDERLFTVHGSAERVVMVGGSSNALALEALGEAAPSAITPPGAGLLQGVSLSDAGEIWAVGLGGGIYSRGAGSPSWVDELALPVQSLHAVWADPAGGVWAVGGNVLVADLDGGVALHRGSSPVPLLELAPARSGAAGQ